MSAWKNLICALVALASWWGGAAAQAPDPYARELARALAAAERGLAGGGFVRAAGPFAGGMRSAQPQTVTLTMRAGVEYLFVGVCASQCDLRLRLADPRAVEVAHGAPAGGATNMFVRPAFTGQHVLSVEAPRCRGSCWYAVNIYTR